MKNIKYILWDIDGTLIDFGYAEQEGLELCFQKFGFGELTADIFEEYSHINHGYWGKI